MAAPERFAIADALLGSDPARRWNNLGCWQQAHGYDAACEALAHLHAQAAGLPSLASSAPLLELACGYGAGLALWQRHYGMENLSAVEFRSDCVAAIQAQPELRLQHVQQGRFDQPLSAPIQPAHFQAVLCVDAAYHAESLTAFLRCAGSALAPGGTLVFSTLLWPEQRLRYWQRQGVEKGLALAGIPAASLVKPAQMQQALQQAGLQLQQIDYLDAPVLKGFYDWVALRHQQLPQLQRFSPGWAKIRATARLCDYLHRHSLLRYGLVCARRLSSSD